MAEDETHDQDQQGIDQRVASLEAGQESLSQKIDKILGLVSGGDGESAHGDEGSGGGTNIAHEIRAQLEDRDRKAKADADEKAKADRLAAAEARIAELSEKPPEPMPRRRERIMGWR